jgi:hypothetical protein
MNAKVFLAIPLAVFTAWREILNQRRTQTPRRASVRDRSRHAAMNAKVFSGHTLGGLRGLA